MARINAILHDKKTFGGLASCTNAALQDLRYVQLTFGLMTVSVLIELGFSASIRRLARSGLKLIASARSYKHRRQGIQDDLLRLSALFFIDVAGFSVA